jgi:two-component system NtrC family response regulator/two-component system response regulator HydG
MVGDSPEMRAVFDVIQQSAATKATVLVLGESGTGKELVVQALHEASPRRGKPFVKLNCAALPDTLLESELFGHERGAFTGAVSRKSGRFERAHGGTLFLDEIGDISPATQVRLLRALQQKEFERVGGTETIAVDVRLVAATNKDLAEEVAAGRFREDLFYRLNVVTVTLPPLRQRKADVPALAEHFLARFTTVYQKRIDGLAPGTLDALLMYEWPGNVRELENALERAVVLCKANTLQVEDLPPALRGHNQLGNLHGPVIPGSTLYDVERYVILRTLDAVGGSTSRAAAVLGVSTRKVQYKLKEYAALREALTDSPPTGEEPPDEEQAG